MAYGGYEDNGYYAKKANEAQAKFVKVQEKEIAKRDVIIQKLVAIIQEDAESSGALPLTDEDMKRLGILKKMLKTKAPK